MAKAIGRLTAVVVLCLVLAPTVALASSIEFTGGATIPGSMNSASNDTNVYFDLQWQLTNLTGLGSQWYFGLAELNLSQVLGSASPLGQDGVPLSVLPGSSVAFTIGRGVNITQYAPPTTANPVGYPDPGDIGATGSFELSTITFSNYTLTLTGTLQVTNTPLLTELGGSLPFSIVVNRVSSNSPQDSQNSFVLKYVEFASGGAGAVNFKDSDGTGGPVVPEPGTLAMMASALSLGGGMFWRRRRTTTGAPVEAAPAA